MERHAKLIGPKFAEVDEALDSGLAELQIANWTRPTGGYFVSLHTLPGLAKRVVEMAARTGVILTPAGATYPYGKDPEDNNIRIAPTYPTLSQVESAMDVLVLCVKLASLQQLLSNHDRN